MVAPHERGGDAKKSHAGAKTFFVVLLVTKHEVDPAESRECTGHGHYSNPHAADANAAVLGGIRLQSDCAQLIAGTRSKEEPTREDRNRERDPERYVRR